MKLRILIFAVLHVLCSHLVAQTYTYSYTDPCTGNLKSLSVPINGTVAVSYYGQLQSFSYSELTSGALETWVNSVFAQFGNSNPCSSIVGLPTAITVTQGTVYNTIGIIGSLTALADLASGASNVLGGSIGSISNSSPDSSPDTNGSKSESNNSSSTTSNSSVNQSASLNGGSSNSGSTTNQSNTNESNSNSNNSGNVSGNGNSESTSTTSSSTTSSETSSSTSGSSNSESSTSVSQEEAKGQSNITAGATNTVKADNNGGSSSGSKPAAKEGGKPQVVASSDFVGFNFRNSQVTAGVKATGGFTSLRWDGARAKGFLMDYTSAQKGPNMTAYYAWIKKSHTTLLSGTATIGFEGLGSKYATVAFGQMRGFSKIPKLKVVYMATASYGVIYREVFLGTAAVAGGMYDWKVNKRIDIKFMNLFVYAPYVSYYNDIVLKSPYVILPSIGTNLGITKRFKFNVNAGGAWDLKSSALNYTVTCGTRLML